jgi:Ca-activated chloride channel family protein
MSLLAPASLLLGLLGVPILILYMLKLRRREVLVSSISLWQKLLHDQQANAPWKRLEKNLLLLLQLLTLAALVFALARPAVAVSSVASGSLVILLDGSASMNARNASTENTSPQYGGIQAGGKATSRFDEARAAALSLVENLPSGRRMSLILVGSQPDVLTSFEADKSVLSSALQRASPGLAEADWQAAFALAAGAASSEQDATIVILSDGGLPADLPSLPAEVRFLPVGEGSENLAVSALSLRATSSEGQLFARVTNFGSHDQQAILSFYADDQLFAARPVSIPAGQSQGIVLTELPEQPFSRVEARLSPPQQEDQKNSQETFGDLLDLDNSAYTMFQQPYQADALLVSQKNIFLEQLLASLPGIQPYRLLPAEDGSFQIPDQHFDLYILDGVYPFTMTNNLPPDANVLMINPPPNELFNVSGVFSDTQPAQVEEGPLTAFVDWQNVHIRQARRVELPEWAQSLVEAPSGPLVFAGGTGGRKLAVVTFDLHDSDLPLQVAFPILFSNLVNFLTPSQENSLGVMSTPGVPFTPGLETTQIHPGESLAIQPPAGAERVLVTSPSGKQYTLTPGENGAAFSETSELGFYQVNYLGSTVNPAVPAQSFAVDLFSPLESDIRPRQTIQVGQSQIAAAGRSATGEREFWPWLAGLALVLMALEWWVYQRRQRLPVNWREWLQRARRYLGVVR